MTRKTIAFLFTVLVVACSSNPVVDGQVGGGQDPPLNLDPVEGGGSPEGSVPPQDAGRDSRTSDANPEDSSVDSSLDAATDSPSSDSSTDSSSDAADSASDSDGGADASGDAGVDAAPDAAPACVVGTTRCAGKVPQICGVGGTTWESQPVCPFDCLNGSCVDCTPGSIKCSANTPQTCSADGFWVSVAACNSLTPFCVAGTCRECNPGGSRCIGQRHDECRGGVWQVTETCGIGNPNGLACLVATASCGGICVPEARSCGTTLNAAGVRVCYPEESFYTSTKL